MRLFRRAESETPADFWAWWPGARDRVASAIETGNFHPTLIEEVSRAVRGVDPRLAWEFAPGRTAKHALCVTPEGNAEVRPAALRWLAGAPPVDATWEYHAAPQASPSRDVLEVGGRRLALSEMRGISSWDESRQRLDVRLWHDVIHLVGKDLDRIKAGIDAWANDAPEWRVKVDFQHDPSWEFQRELGVR